MQERINDAIVLEDSSAAGRARRIVADRTMLAYSQAFASLIAETLAYGLIAILLWTHVPGAYIGAWSLFAGAALIAHVTAVIAYWKVRPGVRDVGPWSGAYLNISVAGGIVLGAAAVLAGIYAPTALQVPVVIVLSAVALVAYVTKAPMLSAAMLNILPLIGPVLYWLIEQGDMSTRTAAGAIMLSGLLLVIVALRSREHMSRLSMITVQNRDLMNNLTKARSQAIAAKDKAVKLNASLKDEMRERERAEQKIRDSERELSSILANIRDVIFRADIDGVIQWVSPAVSDVLQYQREEIVGTPINRLFADQRAVVRFEQAMSSSFGMMQMHAAGMTRRDGSTLWGSITAHYYHHADGGIAGIEGTIRDITSYHETQQALLTEKGRASVTLASIGDGVITTDTDGRIDYLNASAEALTGLTVQTAYGVPIRQALKLVDEGTGLPVTEDPVRRSIDSGRAVRLDDSAVLIRPDGRELSIEISAAPILDGDQRISGAVIALHDVTALREMAQQMKYQATHDVLTGLINRREFETQLSALLSEAETGNMRHCVCYLDLDQFKVVNDTCGHTAGDDLLRAIAGEINNCVRDTDTVARLGGDEFGILLRGCNVGNAQEIAESIRAAVEKFRFIWDGKVFRVGASIGVVPITLDWCDLTKVLTAADTAMYVAKESGRNRVHIYEPDDKSIAVLRGEMNWKHKLQTALEENAFRLYYQPIIPLSVAPPDRQEGEVLLRMVDDNDRIITPDAFMPAAERYHLMPLLDRWVIAHAFTAMDGRARLNLPKVGCSINLSGQSLSDEGLLDYIKGQLYGKHIEMNQLCFEITETAVVSNLAIAIEFIAELRKLGCRFALDDFGSGLSSFGYLKMLPVDFLKIDGNFIIQVTRDRKDRAMVKAINEISHVMGMKTVAENVEDQVTLDTLRALRVDYAQGYVTGKPDRLDLSVESLSTAAG
jgi:diguanylate cyclase (GGDEF)-like protein/PAS domain S-box-containing protein